MGFTFKHDYKIDENYSTKTAYFCMEFALDQPLKTYSGGLGFLAGSFMKSAFELNQNIVGIGILWKYGYYNQIRKQDQTMDVLFEEKKYGFLIDTKIKFEITIAGKAVWVTAFYLPSHVFQSAPIFFLSTDLPENDYLSKTISHKLYDANPETSIAASILLGAGGSTFLSLINWEPEIYHMNESHALPIGFFLLNQFKEIDIVKEKLVYTNHTAEDAANKVSSIALLEKMSYFCGFSIEFITSNFSIDKININHTYVALMLSGKANAVSELHKKKLLTIWEKYNNICPIHAITNAQNFKFWKNECLYKAVEKNDIHEFDIEKKKSKRKLFEIVADQSGEIYDENICTLVFAKRFAAYKRADLLLNNMDRFLKIINNEKYPVQIIWAGKPYPMDYFGIGIFDKIVNICKSYNNCSILVGYEISLSKSLKSGSDIWLNTPRTGHEASGTSGISAAMNGAINLGIQDGWFPEFAKNKENAFVINACENCLPDIIQDEKDAEELYTILENEAIPMYYENREKWFEITKNSMLDIIPNFDSNRMAKAYYDTLYAK
ncbi:MAG: alpha-glucan family phosphorylase [Sphingobacteriales bacterium]|nr:alpha-glucan family phosphorylase [Sphingobacteriales bacterium]